MALIEIDWRPPSRQLRQFAAILLGFAPLVAWVLHWRFGLAVGPATWIGAVGAAVALVGLVVPRAIWPVFVVLMAISLPIGLVVSTLLLIVIYFVVLTPIGLLARLVGYDPMRRQRDPAATSYWIERRPVADVRRYFRQH